MGHASYDKSWASPKRWRKGELLLCFRRKLGRILLNKSPLEKKKSSWLSRFLIGCKRWLVCCCWGREGSSFFSFKAGDETPIWKMSSIVIIICIVLLFVGYGGSNEWYICKSFTFRASWLHFIFQFLLLLLFLKIVFIFWERKGGGRGRKRRRDKNLK